MIAKVRRLLTWGLISDMNVAGSGKNGREVYPERTALASAPVLQDFLLSFSDRIAASSRPSFAW